LALKLLNCIAALFCLVLLTSGQDPPKALIADGSKYYSSLGLYGSEAEDVFKKLQNLKAGPQKPAAGNTYINTPVTGSFYEKGLPSKAYLYSLCDAGNCTTQGIIVLAEDAARHKTRPQFNITYPYRSDVLIVALHDINGDGIDELAVIQQREYDTTVRVLEFLDKKLVALGARQIYGLKATPPFRSRLLLVRSPDGTGKFVEDREVITGKGWTQMPEQEITLDRDDTAYAYRRQGVGILKHIIFATFVVQMLAFVALFFLVIYEIFFAGAQLSDDEKALKAKRADKRKAGKSDLLTHDALPKLEPINCRSCGAPVPLAEGEMTCPSCGTKTAAPADYFDVAKARGMIAIKIRKASAYLSRARLLTSSWMRFGLIVLTAWIGFTIVSVFVLSGRENFAPYQDLLFGGKGEVVTVFGSFTSAFWIVSLLFTFFIWSPLIRKNVPVIDTGENIAEPEAGACPDCGGGISYQRDDLAAVCGYCGVETYRANLAWKLHNVTNTADEQAEFSLIEARQAAEDAVEEVTGTPKVFMILLIVIAVFFGGSWLISAGYNMLPEWLRTFLDLVGAVIDALM
jgi:predicted RNA-binding Zn-ribbon protein involved in translation (DUF1610 family)